MPKISGVGLLRLFVDSEVAYFHRPGFFWSSSKNAPKFSPLTGAIRALVLNENGLAVGDPITRAVDGTTTLTLSATDGFEDISLHAAYRTGQTQPWTLRIFEASSANAQGKEFKKLLELPISSDKH